MNIEKAELIAINALTWTLQNPEYLSIFITNTGVTPQDFKKNGVKLEFLGSILDFILDSDTYTTEFCTAYNYEQTSILTARQMLPGNQIPNWT